MHKIIIKNIQEIITELGLTEVDFVVEHPADMAHGDFATNVALAAAKKLGKNPRDVATLFVEHLSARHIAGIAAIETAGPGFINFRLAPEVFRAELAEALTQKSAYGTTTDRKGTKVMVEYTDPNLFKIFHIGHLMANAVGEALARLIESSGAEIIRACYQSDVGLHVARTMWAIIHKKAPFPSDAQSVTERVKFLGDMYVIGTATEGDPEATAEITAINKKIFEKTDPEINAYYDKGRAWSLEYFETIYKKLGTKFTHNFFESEVAPEGAKVVREFLTKGVFEESEGAVIFSGEKYGLHTRVFINSQGLPTYEAKEIGLTKRKFELEPNLTESVVVTANEQSDYFKVLLKVLALIYPDIAAKTKHFSHGMLRFASGKMSSRKGNIVAAETLIDDAEALVVAKIADRGFEPALAQSIAYDVAVGAIKYSILRQAIGGDIIYDPATSVSFEGDSGPYIQYACVRARAVITKALAAGITPKVASESEPTRLEKLITRYPHILDRARREYAPHHVVTYLIELASAFNGYYAENTIIDEKNPSQSAHRVAVTTACAQVLANGLQVVGIRVPEKM